MGTDWGTFIVIAAIVFGVYFAPSIVASDRKHRNRLAIFVLNVFVGWTGIGWIACLVWACTSNVEPEPVGSSAGQAGYVAESDRKFMRYLRLDSRRRQA